MSLKFEQWMQGSTIYVCFDRYGSFGGGFVAVSSYIDDDSLRDAVEDLEGGDNDMAEARKYIKKRIESGGTWLGSGILPSGAVLRLEATMRDYHRSIS